MNKSSCVCAAPRYHLLLLLLNDVSEKYGIDDWKMVGTNVWEWEAVIIGDEKMDGKTG
jgi:hypothetical protein